MKKRVVLINFIGSILSVAILVFIIFKLNKRSNYYKAEYDKQLEKNRKDSLEYTAIIDSCSSRYFKELKK